MLWSLGSFAQARQPACSTSMSCGEASTSCRHWCVPSLPCFRLCPVRTSLAEPARTPHSGLRERNFLACPQLSQWFVASSLAFRHGLHRRGTPGSRLPHPLCLGVVAGAFFWAGNSGIILGRNDGLARWLRDFISAILPGENLWEEAWEEMATFHLFGLLGNDLLWRSYEWIAAQEVRANNVSSLQGSSDHDCLCSAKHCILNDDEKGSPRSVTEAPCIATAQPRRIKLPSPKLASGCRISDTGKDVNEADNIAARKHWLSELLQMESKRV